MSGVDAGYSDAVADLRDAYTRLARATIEERAVRNSTFESAIVDRHPQTNKPLGTTDISRLIDSRSFSRFRDRVEAEYEVKGLEALVEYHRVQAMKGTDHADP